MKNMPKKTYPKKYQEWVKGLFNCKDHECPYNYEFEAMKEEGVYPRGMMGCVENPKVVVIGLQPGAAGSLEALLCKRAKEELNGEQPCEIVDFTDYMYFDSNRELHESGSYIDSLRDLFEKLPEELRPWIYLTDLVKCQQQGISGKRSEPWRGKRKLQNGCVDHCYERFFKKEMEIILSDPQKKKVVYVLLGGKVEEFFEDMKNKDDKLAKIIWERHIGCRHPAQRRWKKDEITSLAQKIQEKLNEG